MILLGAPAALIARLHSERFGDVCDGIGQTPQGRGPGELLAEALPPGIEQRVDGIRGAGADSGAEPLDVGPLAFAQQRVGRALDVADRHVPNLGGRGDGAVRATQACSGEYSIGMVYENVPVSP